MIEIINTSGSPQSSSPVSQAVRAAGLIFVGGLFVIFAPAGVPEPQRLSAEPEGRRHDRRGGAASCARGCERGRRVRVRPAGADQSDRDSPMQADHQGTCPQPDAIAL